MNAIPYGNTDERAQMKMGGYWDSIVTFGVIAFVLLLMAIEVIV